MLHCAPVYTYTTHISRCLLRGFPLFAVSLEFNLFPPGLSQATPGQAVTKTLKGQTSHVI